MMLKKFVTPRRRQKRIHLRSALRLERTVFFVKLINKKLERQIKLDGPTRLFNKKTFHQDLETYLQEFKRQQKSYNLIMMDMDHFKDLNDSFGHYQGDLFISHFGEYLCNLLPTTGYRIGG